jgi:ppGpp synthetase/RelA/SpoT-type nucleotidyltranferase
MIPQKDFLQKYNISEASFKKSGFKWKQLEEIYNTYEKAIAEFEPILSYLVESLRRIPKVHSIKARLKDPEHLIEKIIREKNKDSSLDITTSNYEEVVTDLIGIRALHLFKADWESIHDWIMNSFEVKEKPVINIREGDQPELVGLFEKKGCDIKKHPFGYRSAHYLVAVKPSKKTVLVEIQVRTIFEEGWSEIDHLIRYPYAKDNSILAQYLVMFNRLAGSADEMASYLLYLNAFLISKELEFNKAIEEKTERNKELQKKIGELEAKIEEMKIDRKDKVSLKLALERISDITTSIPDYSELMSRLAPKIDYSELMSRLAPKIDYSELMSRLAPKIDYSELMSRLAPKMPDYSDIISKLTSGVPDHSDTTAPTINLNDASSPTTNEDLGETADQKSISSDEEDKTNNNKHKKNGEEKKEEAE